MPVRRVVEVELEAERPHALGELAGPPAPLDDAERPPVRERARLLPVRLVGARVRLVAGAAVHQEDPTAGQQRHPHERPELVEPLLGDVREPEGEEDEIEALGRLPLEDIRADELGVRGIERERLGVRVHRDDALGEPDELARPDSRAGGKLEDRAGGRERLERRLRLRYVRLPARERAGLELVAASAEPPVVVLRSTLRVVQLLLGERIAHAATASLRNASTPASEAA